MDYFERLRRQASANRRNKPTVIAALDELGVTGRAAASAVGVSETSYSFWRNGVQELPEKHKTALLELAHGAQRVLQDASRSGLGANKIKLARAEGFLRILEAEASNDK